ncbi:hypothetical protein GS399_01655 [Pedobacter sp. HMF7647]|uniref:HTH luxR-type domain-containing protein n=1 Tax=Hufsiella arboris TaxID=2695275 RepID=A0A7K1Y5K0_9SPHI|nr:LuxR C-terminal-related transcriptional regulator [Hufsiella arboris]MXV49661.1 hypothetical protein [Hufsiella arboris]
MKEIRQFSYNDFLHFSSKRKSVQIPETNDLVRDFNHHALLNNLYPSAIYLIDYTDNTYSSLDTNNNSFLGYSTRFLINAGPSFFYSLWNPEDFKIYNGQIFPEQMEFLKDNVRDDCSEFTFTTNYRIKNKDGSWSSVIQRACYLCGADDCIPVASLGSLTDITHFKNDSKIIHIIERMSDQHVIVLKNKSYFPHEYYSTLSKREVDVLKLVCNGLCSKEIADRLNISIHTINHHRRNMLDKSNCKNLSELVNRAVKSGML